MSGKATSPFDCPAIATDLYELTMAQAYWLEGMEGPAVFDLFVRDLPRGRCFLVAAGLEQALDALESFRFGPGDLEYLEGLGSFQPDFLDYLAELRFNGQVRAVPEGTPIFAGEPLLSVTAPMPQAQLVETCLINQLHLPTLVATKTALLVAAAGGRRVVDFGLRRAHGIEAGTKAARAAYLAGAAATSNCLAGRLFGLPVSGTMAHSYILAHGDELDAFRRFATLYPETVLLVDSYDTLAGVRHVADLARELGDGFRIKAIRLDSGDLDVLARGAREILDGAGLEAVSIVASGDLDEGRIRELVVKGAPIDVFGVGTHLVTSADAPYLNCAYKLVEYEGRGRMKLSSGKKTLPGAKQVYRRLEGARAVGDLVTRMDEDGEGIGLLGTAMESGRRLPGASPPIEELRAYCLSQVSSLPPALLETGGTYPVEVSVRLREDAGRLAASLGRIHGSSVQ